MRQLPLLCDRDHLQNVKGAQTSPCFGRIPVEIDCRQTLQERIHIPHPDQAITDVVVPFLGRKRIPHEHVEIGIERPALGFVSVLMEGREQLLFLGSN